MEAPLEIRYAGVVIGRAQEVRSAEGDALSFFIPVRDPMPVGTVLRVRSGDQETPVRVLRAIEAADPAVCGMHVKTIGEAEEVTLEFIPPPAAAAEKLKPATPTPVVEVDLAKMRSETATAAVAPPAGSSAVVTVDAPAPEPAPKLEAAEATPVASASGPSGNKPAIPEAVPVVIASSMTGALRNATESIPISMPAPEAPTVPSVQVSEPASPTSDTMSAPASARDSTREYGSAKVTAAEVETESAAMATTTASDQALGEDLPPARPISGPSGRRKTKRRR